MAHTSPAYANRVLNLAGATKAEASVHKVLGTARLRRAQIPVLSVVYRCSRPGWARRGPENLLNLVIAGRAPCPRITTPSQQLAGPAPRLAWRRHHEPTTPASIVNGDRRLLHAVLPHSTVLRLPGLNPDSAQTYGKPEPIAAALRLFFGQ